MFNKITDFTTGKVVRSVSGIEYRLVVPIFGSKKKLIGYDTENTETKQKVRITTEQPCFIRIE